jgi:plasmid stabilization system protein ParE
VTLVFHPLAERELITAARFYETRASGLGADFIRQIERTLADVVVHPNAGSLFTGTTIRRRLVQRMHLRRRPGHWRRRIRAGSSAGR